MASVRAFHLPRFAERVLGSMRPQDVATMSYDLESIEPTYAALERFFETGALPPFEVPGKYALVAYEEADLSRHGLVDVARGRSERDSADEGSHKVWVLLATEAFIEHGAYSILETRNFVLGLLAVRAVCDEAERADLGDDLAVLAWTDVPEERVFDAAQLAALAALFAATDGRPRVKKLVERSFALLESAWIRALDRAPSEHAETLATGDRLLLDEDLYPVDTSESTVDDPHWELFCEGAPSGYVQLRDGMDGACIEALARPHAFHWEAAGLDLVARPYGGDYAGGAYLEAAPR